MVRKVACVYIKNGMFSRLEEMTNDISSLYQNILVVLIRILKVKTWYSNYWNPFLQVWSRIWGNTCTGKKDEKWLFVEYREWYTIKQFFIYLFAIQLYYSIMKPSRLRLYYLCYPTSSNYYNTLYLISLLLSYLACFFA